MFSVCTSHRIYLLYSTEEKEMQLWVDCIYTKIEQLKKIRTLEGNSRNRLSTINNLSLVRIIQNIMFSNTFGMIWIHNINEEAISKLQIFIGIALELQTSSNYNCIKNVSLNMIQTELKCFMETPSNLATQYIDNFIQENAFTTSNFIKKFKQETEFKQFGTWISFNSSQESNTGWYFNGIIPIENICLIVEGRILDYIHRLLNNDYILNCNYCGIDSKLTSREVQLKFSIPGDTDNQISIISKIIDLSIYEGLAEHFNNISKFVKERLDLSVIFQDNNLVKQSIILSNPSIECLNIICTEMNQKISQLDEITLLMKDSSYNIHQVEYQFLTQPKFPSVELFLHYKS